MYLFYHKKKIDNTYQMNFNKIKILEQEIILLKSSINVFLEEKQTQIQKIEEELDTTQKEKNKNHLTYQLPLQKSPHLKDKNKGVIR